MLVFLAGTLFLNEEDRHSTNARLPRSGALLRTPVHSLENILCPALAVDSFLGNMLGGFTQDTHPFFFLGRCRL